MLSLEGAKAKPYARQKAYTGINQQTNSGQTVYSIRLLSAKLNKYICIYRTLTKKNKNKNAYRNGILYCTRFSALCRSIVKCVILLLYGNRYRYVRRSVAAITCSVELHIYNTHMNSKISLKFTICR